MHDEDIAAMQRAVVRPDGSAALLRWLARRVEGHAVLLSSPGNPVLFFPDCPSEVLRDAAKEIRRVAAGDLTSASIRAPSWWARVASASDRHGGPTLLVTSRTPLPERDGPLVAHAVALLALRWSADERNRNVAQIREAVLQLLMAGEIGVDPARRVARVLKPDFAALVRVYLVEGTPASRDAIADRCEAAFDGKAWIIRCAVYRHHVIILSPVHDSPEAEGEAAAEDKVLPAVRAASADAAIGAGGAVALRDTSVSYSQAYHALVIARLRADRFARFTAPGDLASVLGPGARHWAHQVLSGLLEYEPSRPRDPGGQELCSTLRSWLDFRGAAWRQLRIHRNTLAERLRHIGVLLGRDLSRLRVQAELDLALQLLRRQAANEAVPPPNGLDGLLLAPGPQGWAKMTLAPLEENPVLLDTVRAWLAADSRADATATALNLSARGVLRRLERVEERLGRSLTGGPNARYDLLLAMRIRDLDG
jgi:sugar diacid utilization regulator